MWFDAAELAKERNWQSPAPDARPLATSATPFPMRTEVADAARVAGSQAAKSQRAQSDAVPHAADVAEVARLPAQGLNSVAAASRTQRVSAVKPCFRFEQNAHQARSGARPTSCLQKRNMGKAEPANLTHGQNSRRSLPNGGVSLCQRHEPSRSFQCGCCRTCFVRKAASIHSEMRWAEWLAQKAQRKPTNSKSAAYCLGSSDWAMSLLLITLDLGHSWQGLGHSLQCYVQYGRAPLSPSRKIRYRSQDALGWDGRGGHLDHARPENFKAWREGDWWDPVLAEMPAAFRVRSRRPTAPRRQKCRTPRNSGNFPKKPGLVGGCNGGRRITVR